MIAALTSEIATDEKSSFETYKIDFADRNIFNVVVDNIPESLKNEIDIGYSDMIISCFTKEARNQIEKIVISSFCYVFVKP
jgi:hypothetical protein